MPPYSAAAHVPETMEDICGGDHLCTFFHSSTDELRVLADFVLSGLEQGERVFCVTDSIDPMQVPADLGQRGVDVRHYIDSGQLVLATVGDIYLQDGEFHPDSMIKLLETEATRARSDGFASLRIAGEAVQTSSQATWLDYESRVNTVLARTGTRALCIYDRNKFPAETLLGVLETHPTVIEGTKFLASSYFEPTRALEPGPKLEHRLEMLRSTSRKSRDRENARQLQRLATLAGGIAHNFNNALQCVLGFADLALKDVDPASEVSAFIHGIREAGLHAANTTSGLLAFAQHQHLSWQRLDPTLILEDCRAAVSVAAPAPLEIRTLLEPGLPFIWADSIQMQRMLGAICENARDAMPDGGVLTLGADEIRMDENACQKRSWASPGHFVRFSISDTGRGMNDSQILRIFDPFYTTRGPEAGAGLGLATVHGIVKQHLGLIEVQSSPGVGSTLSVYLPVANDDSSGVPASGPSSEG